MPPAEALKLLAQDVQTLLQQFRRGERRHRALILRCDIAFMTLSALPARPMSNMLAQTSISKTAKLLHDIDLRHSLSVDQWNRSEFHGCDDAIRSHIGLNHIALTKSRLIGGPPIGKLPRDFTCGWGDGT
jgi:hypothetical protein